MKNVKKVLKRIAKIVAKIITGVITLFALLIGKSCFAASVVEEVNGGGAIKDSALAKGLMNMIKDLTGTLQWIIPFAGVLVILYYIFKIMTGDEQDQMRYKKSIVKVLVCIVISIVAVTIVNLLATYF